MKSIKQILNSKGHAIWSIKPEDNVYDAIKLMAEKEIGSLLVMQGEKLIGIVGERDYARKVILKGKTSRETPVREIMTSSVLCVQPEQTVEECMALITDKRIRHLPVVVEGLVVGIVSIGDLVKAIIADQKFLIDQMEHYITGSPTII